MHSPVIHNLLYVNLLAIAFLSPSFPFSFLLPPSLGCLPLPSHSLAIPILLRLSYSTTAAPFLNFSHRHELNCRARGMSASVRWCCSCLSTVSLVLCISAAGKCSYSLLWFYMWMFFHTKTLFCLNDEGKRMYKILASFTQDAPWQISLSSLAYLFQLMQCKAYLGDVHSQSVCVGFREGNQVWVNTESSSTYIQILNFFKYSKTCWILPALRSSGAQMDWRKTPEKLIMCCSWSDRKKEVPSLHLFLNPPT